MFNVTELLPIFGTLFIEIHHSSLTYQQLLHLIITIQAYRKGVLRWNRAITSQRKATATT